MLRMMRCVGRNMRRCARLRALGGMLAAVGLTGVLGASVARAQGPARIGFIYPDSGPFAQLGLDMRDGFLLYWGEIGNKAAGRAVEILTETKGTAKPDEGLTKARKLVERDRVHILGGVISTPVAYALRSYVIEKKTPLIIMNAGADGLTQKQRSEYIFRSSYSNSQCMHALGDWAYKQGYRKAILMGSDFGASHENVGGFARTFTEAGGQIAQEIYPPLGSPDFAPYLAQVRRDADLVAVQFAGADALRFVTQYAEYGLKDKIALIGKGALTDEAILPKEGDAALGIVTCFQWSAVLDIPENKRFVAAYAAKSRRPPTIFAEQGYVGAQMIAKALEAARGDVENREAFLAALRKVEIDAPRGRVKLDAFQNPVDTSYIRKVEKKDGVLQNTVIASYASTTQFWRWTPEAFMALPYYGDLKGKWTK